MKNIFSTTKIKLTALYLMIIMFVTLSFSLFIFAGVNEATEHAMEAQRRKMERQFLSVPPQFREHVVFNSYKEDAILQIREEVLYSLIVINLAVLVISATLGYYLAERTLKPIEDMLAKQKRFISAAAHEIKTPLTAMKTDIEVTLRDKKLNLISAKEALQRTVFEVDELSSLTTNLLAASKYNNGDVYRKEIKIFELSSLIDKVIKKFKIKASDKNIEIKIELKNEDIALKADQLEIEHAISNVIDNAIKYSNEKTMVLVTISKSENKKYAVIEVKDQGYGISKENIQHIFDPFYRENNARTRSKAEGYGLGLAITKDIIESYSGKIKVESKVEKGSTFTITLPCLEV